MKLRSISAHNFMSLQSFEMNDLDRHITYVVGPNAAGKTTVFRALRVLRDAFAAVHQANPLAGSGTARDLLLLELRRRATQGLPNEMPTEMDISIEVTLDTPREAQLLAAFLAAALSNRDQLQRIPSQEQLNKNLSDAGVAVFSAWLLDAFRNSDLTWLLHGTLSMRCWLSAYDPRLIVGYTCDCTGTPVTFSAGWHPAFNVGQVLAGQLEPRESLGYQAGEAFIQYLKESDSQRWSQILDVLTSTQPGAIAAPLDPQALFYALAGKGDSLSVQGAFQYPFPPAHERLSELAGSPLRDSHSDRVSVATVFWRILREALLFTENVRSPLSPAQRYTWQQLAGPVPEGEDESQLPVRLFWLKSGDSPARATYQQIQDTFRKLVGVPRSFEVVVDRLDVQPRSVMPQQAPMQIDDLVQVSDDSSGVAGSSPFHEVALEIMYIGQHGREMPLADQGAGMWELLVLSSLIHDSAGRVVLLDEPAANLHASAQRTLRDLLRTTQGQFLVVTHSQHLLPSKASDVAQVFRLAKTDRGTQPHHFDVGTASIGEDKLEQELNTSSDVAGLLFASAVVLVEGPTEAAAYATWVPQLLGHGSLTLGDLGIALHPVGSKTNFGFFIRYLSAYDVPWAVIMDGDGFKSPLNLWRAIEDTAGVSPRSLSGSFDERRAQAERIGVFTPNTSEDGDFEDIPEVKAYLDESGSQRSKVRAALDVMRALPCPPTVAAMWSKVLRRFGLQDPSTTPAWAE